MENRNLSNFFLNSEYLIAVRNMGLVVEWKIHILTYLNKLCQLV